ncbi:MAG TPA: CHASE3 domain-containing protein, partial [Terriglobales bacterium]|nr:CHASE3 domain-containing protein [Terriglobales bacterium]
MLMQGRIRVWIIAASVVGLAALAAVSWLSYRNTRELIAANQRLAQAHKLIEDLTGLHLLLDDAESSCRGYALSGKDEYLKPYDAALVQVDISTQVLRHDVAHDTNRSLQFQQLEPTIRARLEVLKELVNARRNGGFEAAVGVVQSNRGKRLADEIRQRISLMQTEERNDLLDLERESRERARTTILAVGLTCLLG